MAPHPPGRSRFGSGWRALGLAAVAAVGAACTPLGALDVLFADGSRSEAWRDVAYGDGPRQQLDVYAPLERRGSLAVVVFFHGGFWQAGSRPEYRFVGTALAARGYVGVVAGYRLHPEVQFPAFIEDAAAAVKWVSAHAAEFGGDPRRIFLMGHSAGGHIAVLLTLDERYLRAAGAPPGSVRGAIGLAGLYDFLPLAENLKPVFGPPERWPVSQPINFAGAGKPPLLLLHGDADDIVGLANTTSLAARVRERGGRVQTVIYPKVGHRRLVLALFPIWQESPPVLDAVAAFVGAH
jgi:acetyl esterase/lipase